jgi:hypothetical protein
MIMAIVTVFFGELYSSTGMALGMTGSSAGIGGRMPLRLARMPGERMLFIGK